MDADRIARLREFEASMRFYIDCEFDGHNGPLLSIGIVSGRDEHNIHIEANIAAVDPWVVANVVPLLDKHDAIDCIRVEPNDVGGVLRAFFSDVAHPIIIADSPVDIGRFCRAISTGPDGGWASVDFARISFEVHNVDCYPTDLPGAVQHNAWWDAMALRHRLAALRTDAKALLDAAERVGVLEGALRKISDIRDSIVGSQTINWSEHVYPLVAALNGAGFEGAGYEIARKNLGTLVDQVKAAEAENARLREALTPFADVAALDIGEDEADNDRFRPMSKYNKAPEITVGHLRRARATLTGDSHEQG